MKIVIRAGGTGTRLWPISRKDNPKQFQAITNEKSLIRNTVDRVKPLLAGKDDLFISVSRGMAGKLKKEIKEIKNNNIISEPAAKNTGPAICLESCVLAKRFGEDIIVASLPSDDYISNKKSFYGMLRAAEKFLKKNSGYIITPAVKPVYPDMGYSYIGAGKKMAGNGEGKIFQVAEWIEKPDVSRCKRIIKSKKYFCHTGMYIWKLGTILDLFREFQPKTYAICEGIVAGQDVRNYSNLEKITIETAITKKAPKIAVIVPEKIGWSDLGKWHVLAGIIGQDGRGNVVEGQTVALDTKNSLIYGPKDKLIATVGLDGMVVVLTEDALLVCPKERSADVKSIVEELEKRKLKKFI